MRQVLRPVLLAVGLVACLAAVPVDATRQGSFECENLWEGPSTDNNIKACILNVERMVSQWKLFIVPLLNAVLLVLLLVSFPLVFVCSICCNCCHCCGANCCKPETKKSSKQARCCLWLYIVYALLWSVMMFFLIIYGSQIVLKAAPTLVDDAVSGPLAYFNQTAEKVMDYTYDWSSGERKEPAEFSIDFSEFSNLQEKVMEGVGVVQGTVFVHFDKVSIAAYVVGSLGFVMVLVILPFAKFKCCIPGFPISISFVYWLFGLAFATLGLLVTVLAYFATLTCGEVVQHHDRRPGLVQWYAVPVCRELFDFHKLNEGILEAEKQLSRGVCEVVLPLCDTERGGALHGSLRRGASDNDKLPSRFPLNMRFSQLRSVPGKDVKGSADEYDTGFSLASDLAKAPLLPFPDVGLPELIKHLDLPTGPILNCRTGITDPSECTTFDAMSAVVLSAEIKGGLGACGVPGQPCNITECMKHCVIPQMQQFAVFVATQGERARNASIAWSYARPLLECNFVIDKIVESLRTCGDITAGTMLLGTGFFVGAVVFGLGIYIMLRGACVWGEIPMFTKNVKAS